MALLDTPHTLADPFPEPDLGPAPVPAPARRRPGLVMELVALADPVPAARRLSALVNNTRVALTELTVAGLTAYPVPAGSLTADGPVVARFSLRQVDAVVDRLLMEELVELVSTVHRVLLVRRTS